MKNLNKKGYKRKEEEAITLISLVITIIILLILSAISIQSLTHTGLFEKANKAKLETKRSQVTEWLRLELLSIQTGNPTGNAEQIITETHKNVTDKQEELKRFGKDVKVEDISTEEDGETVGIYFYVVVDKDVYKVDLEEQKFIGELGKMLPVIKLESISNTTNSIKIKVKTSRNEGGKLEYYIKAENETKYTLKDTKTDDSEFVFEDLVQGKKYNIKVVAIAENGQTAEVTAEQTTGSIIDLTSANVKFTYNPSTWTNGDVTATATANIDITGFTLQTSKDGAKWENTASQTYSENGTIYARLWDGTNYGTAASESFTNIDKTAPTISTVLKLTSTSINSVSLSVGVTDTNSGLGKIEWYYGTTNNPTTKAGETLITEMNGSTTGPTTAQTKTQTISGLSAGTTYYFKVIVYDVAGNQVSSSVISAKTNVPNKNVGQEVTVGGETFFVLNWNSNSDYAELLAKYVLNYGATAQENKDTVCAFSTSAYWTYETIQSNGTYLNLNNYPAVRNDSGSAVYKANSYAKRIGGTSGRLLTYEEVNNLKGSYSDMIWLTYGNLKRYWLGSANNGNSVWWVDGEYSSVQGGVFYYDSNEYGFGVGLRPVVNILKSKIS